MNLNRRLERLETQFISDPIILWLADGSTRQIHYNGPRILDLFMAALSGEAATSGMEMHLNWIRESVGHHDPNGGHMIELIRLALNAPASSQRPPDQVRPPQLGPIPTKPRPTPGGGD